MSANMVVILISSCFVMAASGILMLLLGFNYSTVLDLLGLGGISDTVDSVDNLETNLENIATGTCPSGTVNEAGLCYTPCKSGYTDGGSSGFPEMCYANCPSSMSGTLTTCNKAAPWTKSSYPWQYGDAAFDYAPAGNRCKAANAQGCTQYGLIWYANCPSGWYQSDDFSCLESCPANTTDSGLYCTKDSYGRGAGTIP